MNPSISLVKNQKIDLSQNAPSLAKASVILGWDNNEESHKFNIDIACFLLGEDGKMNQDKDFIYFQNPVSICQSVTHAGEVESDNNDKQIINIDFEKIPFNVDAIYFVATIHDADILKQDFSQIKNPFIRMVDSSNNYEILNYYLKEDYSNSTAILLVSLFRHNDVWKFRAFGNGESSLQNFFERFQ